VVPIAYAFSTTFYACLFAADPRAGGLFAGPNMAEQGAKLIQMLGVMVRDLPELEDLKGAVGELARRQVSYGVRPEQYDAMGAALLWTLERALGPVFTRIARRGPAPTRAGPQ
jgi:hemoglobin-like flavoprotein